MSSLRGGFSGTLRQCPVREHVRNGPTKNLFTAYVIGHNMAM